MDKSCMERIKDIRKSTGLSQVKFSKKYGIPLRTIESWETGVREAPDYTVDLLAFAINNGYEKSEV